MVIIQSSSGVEAIHTSCFELRFRWHEDRWRHEVVSVGPSGSIPRLASLEAILAEDDHSRVISPTYQQIHMEQDASGSVRAFLIGQSGPHHFSAVFLVEEDAEAASIDVDAADRCLSPVLALAATYSVEASSGEWGSQAISDPDPDASGRSKVTIQCSHPVCCLTFEVDPPGRHAVEEAGHGAVRVQAVSSPELSDHTHRFRYRWRWEKDKQPSVWDHNA